VIQRLRALFRKGEVREEVMDLNLAVQEVVLLLSPQASERGVTIDLEMTLDLPEVLGDPIQLQQIVSNLLTNGMEAMRDTEPESRRLVVRTSRVDPAFIQVSVQDSGCGMDEDVGQRIFDPFFTTKAEGMGMGLAISRSIIESHGGRLWVESNNKEPGVTFSFTIPVERKGRE
jgi:signal transduction histidine kinase